MPGNNLYPLKYVSELFQQSLNKCQRSDKVTLDLYTHVPVINVERTSVKQGQRQRPSSDSTSPRWIVNTSRGDSIRARTVIHATNGYASSVVPSLANGPNRIVPTRGQVMAYQPRHDSSSDPRWTTAFASPGGREYFFQRPGDQGPIILGGARYSAGKPFEFGESDDGVVNSKVEKALAEYLPMQFPGYFAGPDREGREAQCWTGVMGYREGGVPMVSAVLISLHCIRLTLAWLWNRLGHCTTATGNYSRANSSRLATVVMEWRGRARAPKWSLTWLWRSSKARCIRSRAGSRGIS